MTTKNQILRTRNKEVLFAEEITYGAEPVLSAGNTVLAMEVSFTPLEGNTIARNIIRPTFGNSEELLGTTYSKLDITCELTPSGTLGIQPQIAGLLKACGFVETVTTDEKVDYTLTSKRELFPSLTFWVNLDGTTHVMTGSVGTFTIGAKESDRLTVKFSFTGLKGDIRTIKKPTELTSLAKWIKPLPTTYRNTTLMLNGIADLGISDFNVDVGNDVKFNSQYNTQVFVDIFDRKSKGDITLTGSASQIKTLYDTAEVINTTTLEFQHGKTAGNIVKITSPSTQIIKPTETDVNGLRGLKCPLSFIPVNGDDELAISFM